MYLSHTKQMRRLVINDWNLVKFRATEWGAAPALHWLWLWLEDKSMFLNKRIDYYTIRHKISYCKQCILFPYDIGFTYDLVLYII